ncbi:MAG: hypothetical protein AB7S38_02555 [Vulcanimicrobiota bacterium]
MPKLSLLLLLLLACGPAWSQTSHQAEWILSEEGMACHVTFKDGRLVAAFPAENSGVAFWLDQPDKLVIKSVSPEKVQTGQAIVIEAEIKPGLRCQDVMIDSLRAIRERSHDPQFGNRVRQERNKAGLEDERCREATISDTGRLTVRRKLFTGALCQAVWTFPPQVDAAPDRGGFEFTAPAAFPVTLRIHLPFEPLPEFEGKLITPETEALLDERGTQARRALRFLVSREKFMAGSWRFLTYFGRDTLISLALLAPAVKAPVKMAGIQSVLARLSPQGQVAHEEDLGEWALYQHLRQGEVSAEPIYDYKMVDDDFLLPIVVLEVLDAQQIASLDSAKLDLNRELVLSQAEQGLVPIGPGLKVGDWRDSEEGMGGGVYSGNVNFCLVPAALEAVRRSGKPAQVARAEAQLARWPGLAQPFWVTIDPLTLRTRLTAYLASLPAEEQGALKAESLASGVTVAKFLEGAAWPGPAAGLTFPALSLDAAGKPVEVVNSDIGFLLFFSNPSQERVEQMLTLLELPYPVGIMTPVGPLAANPAFSINTKHWKSLGHNSYHGTVIWSWQSALLTAGLLKQREAYPALAPRLEAALASLARAEGQAGRLANTELWGFKVGPSGWKAVAYGAAGDETESNTYQLWSTAYLGNLIRRHRAGL